MKISGYIISLLLILQSLGLWSQPVKRPRDWVPSLLFLSADVVGLAKMASSGDVQAEFSAKTDFDQFFLAFDFGIENRHLSGRNFDYSSDGRFYRIGPQVNFMQYNKNRSNLFFGLSYASATLSDHINYFVPGQTWDDADLEYSNVNLKARWFEANLGLNVRVAGPLFLGYTVRFKLAKSMDTTSELSPYNIPGFGKAENGSNFGFNYYITYRFGFRKKVIPERPKPQKRLEKVPTNENQTKQGSTN